jgi:hypothetical protein
MTRARSAVGAAFGLLLTACVGTTGGENVSFRASATGVNEATDFTNSLGYHVVLSRARLHVGAVYLNQSVPTSGGQETSCVLPGIYVAEVFGPLTVDALSTKLQEFRGEGEGIALNARAAELWLSGGDINAIDDATVILDAAGVADKDGSEYPFEASLTIGKNRLVPSSNPALPGANPICKQRIVSPIPVDLTPRDGGRLLLRVDARAFFTSVDFATLTAASSDPPLFRFDDSAATSADINLYRALRSRGAYQLDWQ